jgi:hypothetical protein
MLRSATSRLSKTFTGYKFSALKTSHITDPAVGWGRRSTQRTSGVFRVDDGQDEGT